MWNCKPIGCAFLLAPQVLEPDSIKVNRLGDNLFHKLKRLDCVAKSSRALPPAGPKLTT
jgi:hypothetical protein